MQYALPHVGVWFACVRRLDGELRKIPVRLFTATKSCFVGKM
jgi:hypothetical protein